MSNPIGRRGILGLILGAGATAAAQPRVTLAQASAAMGVPVGATISETVEAATGVGVGGPATAYPDWWAITNMIEQDNYKRRVREVDLPPHIACKRSWSRVFKNHAFAAEQRIMDSYLHQIRSDDEKRIRFLSALGFKFPGVE